jgi:hypothetical protein
VVLLCCCEDLRFVAFHPQAHAELRSAALCKRARLQRMLCRQRRQIQPYCICEMISKDVLHLMFMACSPHRESRLQLARLPT